MPINKGEEYLIKAKTDGVYRIVGNIMQGDYGPRISLINSSVLKDLLAGVEEGRRIFLPVFIVEEKKDN